MQASVPECQKKAFLRFWKFEFSWGSMPPDHPTLLYTQQQLYPTNCVVTKYNQGNVNSFWASAGLFLNDWTTDESILSNT